MKMLNIVMDLMMAPLRLLRPEVALICFSMLTGAVILLLFKISSNPVRIASARNRALSRVLELWLWREDAVGGLFSVGRAMADSLLYLSTMLRPALVSMLPMLLLLIQANAWFGARPLREGDVVIVTVRASKAVVVEDLQLESNEAVTVEATVTSPDEWEKGWRIRAKDFEGTTTLRIHGGGVDETKLITIGKEFARLSVLRTAGRMEHILYPDEPRLVEGLELISVAYMPALYTVAGVEMPWILPLLVVSLITGLVLKKPMGVEF